MWLTLSWYRKPHSIPSIMKEEIGFKYFTFMTLGPWSWPGSEILFEAVLHISVSTINHSVRSEAYSDRFYDHQFRWNDIKSYKYEVVHATMKRQFYFKSLHCFRVEIRAVRTVEYIEPTYETCTVLYSVHVPYTHQCLLENFQHVLHFRVILLSSMMKPVDDITWKWEERIL